MDKPSPACAHPPSRHALDDLARDLRQRLAASHRSDTIVKLFGGELGQIPLGRLLACRRWRDDGGLIRGAGDRHFVIDLVREARDPPCRLPGSSSDLCRSWFASRSARCRGRTCPVTCPGSDSPSMSHPAPSSAASSVSALSRSAPGPSFPRRPDPSTHRLVVASWLTPPDRFVSYACMPRHAA